MRDLLLISSELIKRVKKKTLIWISNPYTNLGDGLRISVTGFWNENVFEDRPQSCVHWYRIIKFQKNTSNQYSLYFDSAQERLETSILFLFLIADSPTKYFKSNPLQCSRGGRKQTVHHWDQFWTAPRKASLERPWVQKTVTDSYLFYQACSLQFLSTVIQNLLWTWNRRYIYYLNFQLKRKYILPRIQIFHYVWFTHPFLARSNMKQRTPSLCLHLHQEITFSAQMICNEKSQEKEVLVTS